MTGTAGTGGTATTAPITHSCGIPIPTFEVEITPGGHFTFWCPHCRGPHMHGGGGVGANHYEYLGHRVAHCWRPNSPYARYGYYLAFKTKQ
jgi:hypothetical protein